MTRNRAFNIFAAAVMVAGLTAWPADAYAQQRGGGSGRGGSQGGQGRGGAPQGQSRPRTGPATGQAVQRPAGRYPGGGYYGYRPYYRTSYYYPYYRGYYAPYYGYGYGWGWGLSVGWGWDGWYGWGYPYGYAPYYPYPYPFRPYSYYYEPGVDLRIEVTPRDAEVYLDGYLVGVVDNFDGTFQRLRVPYGEHSIAIYFEGYRTIEQKMLFRPGESYKIKQPMVALAAGDPAEPRPTPAAASPRDEYGRPPMRDEYARPPARGGGQPDMPPPAEARGDFGSIAIRVQPGDAEILIDGERWEAPGGGGRLVVDLAEGNHVVEIRKDGHKPYSADVQVRRGRTSSLNVSLPPGL